MSGIFKAWWIKNNISRLYRRQARGAHLQLLVLISGSSVADPGCLSRILDSDFFPIFEQVRYKKMGTN